MKTFTITLATATILSWKRARNTLYGNPVFLFTITDESGKVYSGKTRPNGAFVYGLCSSPSSLQGVTIATTPTGRVYMDNAKAA